MRLILSNPPAAPAPAANYSQVARVELPGGALLFLSGQVAMDAEGNLVGKGDAARQAESIFENMARMLEESGGSLRDVAKLTFFFTDMGHRQAVAEVRDRYFGDPPPASTAVQITRLVRPEWLIEIEAVAAVSS
jgi:reactive intermediate/imine deaminase